MKRLIALFVLMFAITGCHGEINVGDSSKDKSQSTRKEYPTVNLPYALRQKNWLGSKREGSCVHASLIDLFIWQGRLQTAAMWRRTHGNGENCEHLAEEFNLRGIRFAETTTGDVEFLRWACDTRRGCCITVMGGDHMVTLVHFDDERAAYLDSNDTTKYVWVPSETLVAEWQNSYGWAVAPVYTPAPPLPN